MKLSKIVLSALLVLIFLQPFLSARQFGPVTDEVPHLASGYSYWKTGEIGLNKQHPPLIKLLASFPMLLMNIAFNEEDLALGQWLFGKALLFSNNADAILFWGRLVPMLLSVLLGYFVYRWAKELFQNDWAGITALGIYAFMPNLIAHAQFVTTDLGVTAFGFITLYWLWRYRRSNLVRHLVLTSLFLGCALATKFSAIVLLPIVIVAMGRRWQYIPIIGLIAFAVLFIIYLFPSTLDFYLDGYRALYEDRVSGYAEYLNGNFSKNGFWHYFLVAFLIKTPIPFLIGLAGSIMYARKLQLDRVAKIILWGTPLLFFLAATFRAENIGVRYILPMYPFLIVLIAGAGMRLIQSVNLKMQNESSKFKNFTLSFFILIFALSIWYIIGTIHIAPDYLAYFNEFIGGPKNGYKYLDDSNLEWGQDVKRLAAYQKDHPDLNVVYPWEAIDLSYYGITNNVFDPKGDWWREPHGRYAVSMFYLIRAKEAGMRYHVAEVDWLSQYKPVDKIGYSYFVYEF